MAYVGARKQRRRYEETGHSTTSSDADPLALYYYLNQRDLLQPTSEPE